MATPKVGSNSPDSKSLRDALAQLRLRLLDLTGRNRLLNYKHPLGKSLQFVEGEPTTIYEKLAEGKAVIGIKGLPEPTRTDWVLNHGRWSRPEPREWATRKGIPTSYDLPEPVGAAGEPDVRAIMYRDDLAKHCRKIERESVLAIEETGANMLYLVLGFLDFPDQKDSDRVFSAPLLSIPVVLSKKESGGYQQFFIRYTGDDISENLSLREKLRQDHGLTLPELDEEEIDVEAYFASIRKVIKSRIGFALRRRVSLCLLSFTNMLLVRDLDPDNWPQKKEGNGLLDHPIVKTVFSGGGASSNNALTAAEEYPIEQEPAQSIPLIFDADSSQHSALVDVLANKRNVVIEGPPGTGKSQTITNLIAASLARGQRVLFVSEKLAALQVVLNRLSIAGLDPFVLELHSTKTSKKQVLEQIAKRLEYRVSTPRELARKIQELDSHRNDLKTYADLLNSNPNTAFGLTLHELMWKAEKHRQKISQGEATLTEMTVSDAAEISAPELSRRMQALEHLSEQFVRIGVFSQDHAFWGFFPNPMVPGDELRLERVILQAVELSSQFAQHITNLSTAVGPGIQFSKETGTSIRKTVAALLTRMDDRLPLHLLAGFLSADGSGRLARRELEALRTNLQTFHALKSTVESGLIREESANPLRLRELQELQRLRTNLNCNFTSVNDVQRLVTSLKTEIDHLTSAHQAIQGFCSRHGVPFDGTIEVLEPIRALASTVCAFPEEHFHLQSNKLTNRQSVGTIEHLASLQGKWIALEGDLGRSLYLDHLPDDATLTRAIITLRQGDTWYRILQPSWRSALSLHKKLLRMQSRMRAAERLNDLHRLVDLRSLKSRWRSDPAWEKYLGISAPEEPFVLDPHLAVAKWNQAINAAMDAVGVQMFDPAALTAAEAREKRREFADFEKQCKTLQSTLENIIALLPGLDGHRTIRELLSKAELSAGALETHIPFLSAEARSTSTIDQTAAACQAALDRKRLLETVNRAEILKRLLAEQFLGVDTDADRLLSCVDIAEEINRLEIPNEFRAVLLKGHASEQARQVISVLDPVLADLGELDKFELEMRKFGDFQLSTWVGESGTASLSGLAERVKERASLAASHIDDAIPWSVYVARRLEVRQLGLGEFLQLLERLQILPEELPEAYAYTVFASIVRNALRRYPQLGKFSGLKHSRIREEFKRLDSEIIHLRGKDVAARCLGSAAPPTGSNGTRVDEKTQMVLLNYLLPQQRPRMPVRKILKRAGHAVQALKPCFMMGPQAVAQYLSPEAVGFDLIIMDEASQLKPEEAIGAIARGSQLVVVGDPKQLPPTSFFTRMIQVGEDDDQFTTTDAESILDVCLSHFRPARQLRWHYRSQHHSLIAFSNHYFYRNLIVFPSPYGHSSKLGIRATYLADAVYDDQTNYKEAVRVVDAVIDHIKNRPDESLGVVTLNLKQRELIAELLEDRLQSVAGAESYRERWRSESQPLFTKNLENVQGDERDAIIISTTFGKPAGADAVRQNFGPISRQGGWRRLNVLFTRAKKSVALFTSMKPEDIVVDGTTPEGTKALRNYLEYARTGSLTTVEETGAEPDSDFETAVINVLKARGYEVTAQLGVAGYRIDIAVKHPEYPGAYLAAIECDGASYHSALSVRDRDRIRQEILESMGWRGRIWRIWSTDWFRMPRVESEKLVSFLEDLRKAWRPEHASGQSWVEIGKSAGTSSNGDSQESETVRAALLDFGDDPAVRVGDTVRYIDVRKPDDMLTVQITEDKRDMSAGILHRGTPLAQTLLGAVAGDEVTMHLPGASPRTFRIVEVKRATD